GRVAGLLLAPAVLFRLAEAGDIALSAVGEDAIAPLVVGAHPLVRGIGVAVAMHREAERQPRRDKRRRGRYANAETRHREHVVRQTQEPPLPPGVCVGTRVGGQHGGPPPSAAATRVRSAWAASPVG